MDIRENVIIIPALDPDKKLLNTVANLHEEGLDKIILVNDGSDAACEHIFLNALRIGCEVVTHEVNRGKGAALKSGISAALKIYGENINIITADADGQHKAKDILKVAQTLSLTSNTLVLGTRDFSGSHVPFKSRFGNRITSKVFKLTTGVKCPDTQTGLRGIPASLINLALETEGSRYEYEMNFLNAASKIVPFSFVPIETIYESDNKGSHFRPVKDSLIIYGSFLRFLAASITGFLVDYGLFTALLKVLKLAHVRHQSRRIMIATIIARIFSGIVNFVLNKKLAFKSKGNTLEESIRYLILFLCQMGASALFTAMLSTLLPAAAAKIIVDTCLFFVSFIVQKRLVFRPKDSLLPQRSRPQQPR
ncbi:MAG: bifunctional glycosyltransferase family 2/GtrA family protein [Lachnospiraceae bacterium]|nr:bifunctional glycosyltransferase family 2/GtrA family protein [Lachnospiraceae bacterium]